MRAILVSVDYGDILSITLPHNRHHFEEVMIVTTPEDEETQRVARENNASIFTTRSFYDNGAHFNKWVALEEGIREFGRRGWMAVMDADILWPRKTDQPYEEGYLYAPKRRILPRFMGRFQEYRKERLWTRSRPKRDLAFFGYTQIFHAHDPCLEELPWFQLDWMYAAGGDWYFQNRWPAERKRRTDWGCLHLGQTSLNWCGRITPRLDGAPIPEARERDERLKKIRKTAQIYRFGRTAAGERQDERIHITEDVTDG